MAVADLVYLFCSTLSDIRNTSGFQPVRKKCGTRRFIVLGLSLVVILTFFPAPCQSQGQGRTQGHRYGYNRPRHIPREEGGGLAFIMDNWLFDRRPSTTTEAAFKMDNWLFNRRPSTTTETERLTTQRTQRPRQHQNEIDGNLNDNEVTGTYIETSWNEPASLTLDSREYYTSEEATKSTFTSAEIGEGESSSTPSKVKSTEASSTEVIRTDPTSTQGEKIPSYTEEDRIPSAFVRTGATQASTTTTTTTSGENGRNSPTPREQEGRTIRNRNFRNRNTSGTRGEERNDPEDDPEEGKKRTTRQKEVKTTEASKPAVRKKEEKKTGPIEGDIKLEGGDVEGTGNVIIYR